jgi:hypothetical protein
VSESGNHLFSKHFANPKLTSNTMYLSQMLPQMILPHKPVLTRLGAKREVTTVGLSRRMNSLVTAKFVGSLVRFGTSVDAT